MDEVYMLVNEGFVLQEFSNAIVAREFGAFMSRVHPDTRYCIIEDD
jgi:hypothetical protein